MPLMRALRASASTALLALAALLVPAWAQDLQSVPALTAHVLDETGTLDAAQLQALDAKLDAFEKGSGSQVVMLLVPTTQPEDIASYANRVGNTWKIGRKGVGDGLLLVVAKNDRKVRIEVAKALEGAIPDLAAKQVIDEAITPAFRRGDYAAGLDAAADRIMALIKGEALPAPAPQAAFDVEGFDWEDLAIFIFFAVMVGASVVRRIFGRKLGALLIGAGTGAVALVVTSSLLIAAIAALVAMLFGLFASFNPGSFTRGSGGGWSSGGGGWSGGSGGGGFSSGGGGDFGGGGASGDW
ncbi:MAG: YgcG family protein [Ramlibacter sp.]